MKYQKRSLTFLATLALSTAAFAQASTAAATDPVPNAPGAAPAATAPAGVTKIAIIMFQPAVAQTNEGQRDFSELQKKFQPKQSQLKSQSDEIDSLKKSLQTAGANLSDQERAQRLKTIDEKEKALQRAGEDAQNDFQSEMQDTYQRLAEKVYGVVQAYAQQNGYSLVIDGSSQSSSLIYAVPSIDITSAIVQAYNAKSGVPAPAAPAPGSVAPTRTTPAARPATSTPRPKQ